MCFMVDSVSGVGGVEEHILFYAKVAYRRELSAYARQSRSVGSNGKR